jgi:hypothetical protein
MRFVAACLGVVAITAARAAVADGSDWRFCVAADYGAHVAYLTPPFESEAAGKDLEGRVGARLTQENLPFQNVQCRLPTDLIQSEAERGDAKAFIKALGFRLQRLQ